MNKIAHELNQAYVFSNFQNRLSDMLGVITKYRVEILNGDESIEDLIRMTEIPAKYVKQITAVLTS